MAASGESIPFSVSRALAPMINQSDAPFRTLCLRYGATCAYTEMLYGNRIVENPSYLDQALPSCDDCFYTTGSKQINCVYTSRPKIVQLCGNDPTTMGIAASKVLLTKRADAIDFNLGCPQDRAREGKFGSYLLDKSHWPQVFACVEQMKTALNNEIPLFCKIRFCEDGNGECLEQTIAFCRGLVQHGADLICIHGRTRGSAKFRRCGPADVALIGKVALALTVPILANGNITCRGDVESIRTQSHPSVGVMSAEGMLADPAMYSAYSADSTVGVASAVRTDGPDRNALFEEYAHLSDLYLKSGGWRYLHLAKTGTVLGNKVVIENTDELDKQCVALQVSVARQHLTYMLGKKGHGRTVRYLHKGDRYRRHVDLLNVLNIAKTMKDLLEISQYCLIGVFGSLPFQTEKDS